MNNYKLKYKYYKNKYLQLAGSLIKVNISISSGDGAGLISLNLDNNTEIGTIKQLILEKYNKYSNINIFLDGNELEDNVIIDNINNQNNIIQLECEIYNELDSDSDSDTNINVNVLFDTKQDGHFVFNVNNNTKIIDIKHKISESDGTLIKQIVLMDILDIDINGEMRDIELSNDIIMQNINKDSDDNIQLYGYLRNLTDKEILLKYFGHIKLLGNPDEIWSEDKPLSEWNNIQFKTIIDDLGNEQEIITSLDLNNLDITEIPPEIGLLTGLEQLLLYNNKIQNLPNEIGNLINLKVLWLFNNNFTNIPSQICELINLEILIIHTNYIEKIDPCIGNLTKLRRFGLSNNHITQLPPQIGYLINLTHLNLESNHIRFLPSEIGCLKKLEYLDLEQNNIEYLPDEIGELSNLDNLYLCDNQLSNLPNSIIKLSKLKDINIDNNKIQLENLDETIIEFLQDKS